MPSDKNMTISEQLRKVIDELEEEINEHGFCNLIFKFREDKFFRFEKELGINANELKVGMGK